MNFLMLFHDKGTELRCNIENDFAKQLSIFAKKQDSH